MNLPTRLHSVTIGVSRRWLLLVMMEMAVGLFGGCAAVLAAEADGRNTVPADFVIKLESAPIHQQHPLQLESIVVSADGTALLSPRIRGAKTLEELRIQLPPDDVETIFAAMERLRFFTLEPSYTNPDVIDGDYALLEVTANGRSHRVRTQNIRVMDFDILALTINTRVPAERRVIYNALLDKSYKMVER
ncbi:MAG: hypothetical protein WC997_05265 [Porticoccaceae bacterium]